MDQPPWTRVFRRHFDPKEHNMKRTPSLGRIFRVVAAAALLVGLWLAAGAPVYLYT
jgi:hypothetical protein